MKWSTSDVDNDDQPHFNCADFSGPGWHKSCCKVCPLNSSTGRFWRSFQKTGTEIVTTMKWMIR